MSNSKTVVELLKDLGADFGCKGDVYANTEAQMDALRARAKKVGLNQSDAYRVVTQDEQTKASEEKKAAAAKKGPTANTTDVKEEVEKK